MKNLASYHAHKEMLKVTHTMKTPHSNCNITYLFFNFKGRLKIISSNISACMFMREDKVPIILMSY